MRILFTIICIFMVADCAHAQILMSKPYIEIIDTLHHKKFKLKKGKLISIKTTENDTLVESRVNDFNYSFLQLANGSIIPFNTITYLQFRPKSKVRKIFKTGYYVFWGAVTSGMAYSYYMPPGVDGERQVFWILV